MYMAKRIIFVITKTIKDMATKRVHKPNPALVKRIKEAEKAISEGKTTKIKDINKIWESIL